MSYESKIWNNESALAKRYQKLQGLVPSCGNCETIEGETLRALGKVGYRYFNDGDFFYCGYGIETAGAAHAFLTADCPIAERLEPIFKACEFGSEDAYMEAIDKAAEVVFSWIEEKNGELTPNTESLDMLNSDPAFEPEPECNVCGNEESQCQCEECWTCGNTVGYDCECDDEDDDWEDEEEVS